MNDSRWPLKGIVGYLITPFREGSGAVDRGCLSDLTETMISSGVHGVAPLGSTGCLPYLTDSEREDVLETVIGVARGRVPVLAGISAMRTDQVLHHARFAETCGAAAVMLTPLSYWRLTPDEIYNLYRAVGDAISIPIMAYNNPGNSGVDLPLPLLERITQIDNVTMVKESSGDIRRLSQIHAKLGEKTAIFCGQNFLAFPALAAGARGWCTASAHLVPELSLELYRLTAIEGDVLKGRALFEAMLPLLDLLVDGGLPRTIAAGLEILGRNVGPLRAPLLPLDRDLGDKLAAILLELRARIATPGYGA